MITKEDFEAYEKVRKSGEFNMFDITGVSMRSGLNKEEIQEIMTNYNKFKEKFEVQLK